ncbi:ATP-binding cassette domain-containing protein [Fructilactobacillus lindneri]|uniref:ABC transporter ATP-binding protein n=1 Tax=Fructilactobacillus lindneri TaxID=53444 RepID=A0AB33BQC5_9LACO|nr:ATP-binding cassette domain-containing protein [Fructilactobacillus lindneri]ANZ58614.1 ABC transporter ATP-binding protein [Fructilactobacillus lindneri]POG98989.1 ABC transporter ATP-binding protein [Fructilactobacillus lindneri]POG99310.1 ABC transporter ATP-binding protein [Fructilactobacillus lindneri]
MSDLILETHDLWEEFSEKKILNNLSFKLKRGSFLSVVGENGVGKTTLVRIILGQLKPTHGTIKFFPNRKSIRIGYVPQFRNIDDEYPLSVKNFVALSFSGYKLPWLSRQERQQLKLVLQETDLEKIANEPLGRASGGEKQRAYLAQALTVRPDLLILDESTASLDPISKENLLRLVKKLNVDTGVTVLFVTHDIPLAKQFSDEYLLLQPNGYEVGPIDQLQVADYEGGQHV